MTTESGSGRSIVLSFQHGFGDLAPYFEGLRAGRAMAARDRVTGRVEFPPRPGPDTEWVRLPGTGRLAALTHGPARLPFTDASGEWVFALIAMDGADNLAFGRVDAPAAGIDVGARVRLTRWSGRTDLHPAAAALYEPCGE